MSDQRKHTAGAFDVRTFIAALLGIFGFVILLAGIFGPEHTAESTTDGHVINIWVGVALLVFAAVMQGWAMLRPTIVDEAALARDRDAAPPGH